MKIRLGITDILVRLCKTEIHLTGAKSQKPFENLSIGSLALELESELECKHIYGLSLQIK